MADALIARDDLPLEFVSRGSTYEHYAACTVPTIIFSSSHSVRWKSSSLIASILLSMSVRGNAWAVGSGASLPSMAATTKPNSVLGQYQAILATLVHRGCDPLNGQIHAAKYLYLYSSRRHLTYRGRNPAGELGTTRCGMNARMNPTSHISVYELDFRGRKCRSVEYLSTILCI